MTAAYVVAGPERHGVVLHGLRLARASRGLAAALVRIPTSALAESADLAPARLGGHERVMVQVTDRLFGATPAAAARRLSLLADVTRLIVCLHDLPHPAEGAERCARRRQAYAEIAEAADTVVVASEHERILLGQCGVDVSSSSGVVVIPLPLERVDGGAAPTVPGAMVGEVGVLGFVYPGKGIEHVIDAVARLTARGTALRVTNYGALAEGHADYAAELESHARTRGVTFTMTGFLPQAALTGLLRSVTVPVAAHRHVSASGSVGTWLGAGRRPVVVGGGWATELATRLPGSVTLTDDLPAAISTALLDPATTWLGEVPIGPSWATVADRHRRLLEPES